jgi:toxin ParE1/3/4
MTLAVVLLRQARRDLQDIYRYIEEQSGSARADDVLSALNQACQGLSRMPSRGNVPKELRALGIEGFREVHYKPYRVIYRITGETIVVFCILDGRRDMPSLLQRRLVR